VSVEHVAAGAVAAVVAAALAWLGPRVVARLPEPEEPAADKRPYADLGAVPGLAARLALVAAVAAGSVGLVLGASATVTVWVYVCAVGVVLSYVDWHTRLLPYRLVAPSYGVVGALVLAAAAVDGGTDLLVRAVVGWLVSFGLFVLMWLVYSKGLGYGDVRLSGVLGMALGAVGWQELLVGMYAAFLFGALGGGLLALARKVDRKGYPFGPFMVLGAWFGVVSGPWLAGWFA
jgi:leader peptidase (prepilin peptidase)/N-methyltransferase